jgi:hypothetical protein
MNKYALSRLRISKIMSELAKHEQVPRLENIFKLAAKAIYSEFDSSGTTAVLEESMGFFLRECRHPVNRTIFEVGVEKLTSSNVVNYYINDSEFFSMKGNALQSLIFIKEAMQHHVVFTDICILEQIEKYLRDIDCYVPAVMNDLFCILQIPFTKHESIETARPNTEILIQK